MIKNKRSTKKIIVIVSVIFVLLCLLKIGVKSGVSVLAQLGWLGKEDHSIAISYMHDIGEEIKTSILSTTLQGLQKTRLLAQSPDLIKALENKDTALIQQIANQDILNSLELDVVAIFDKGGQIVAINTVDQFGKPIPHERLDRVMQSNFEGREIISGCLLNKNRKAIVEFQTQCDFTPALFDSSGLSVAFSVPVAKSQNGDQVGLISTRLNFKRILDIANRKNRRFAEKDIFLVSDGGKYFSEEINSGKQAPPIPGNIITDLIRPVASSNQSRDVLLNWDQHFINIFSLGIRETMEKGNLYVLLRAPKSWLESESKKSKILIAGLFIAIFTVAIAAIFLILLGASRSRAVHLARKMTQDLHKEMEERKRLESRIVQTEKMAAIGKLAGGVAHEINNPLGVILGFSQNLAKRIEPGNPFEMPLKSIEREAVRCKNLVQDLLTFSRVEKGEKEEIDLNETLATALSLVNAQGEGKQVEIETNHQLNLPKIFANRTQIQQIILNLVNNAIDAMPEGGKIKILTKAVDPDSVGIDVEDTGCGIPEKIQKRVFEPFFTTKPIGKGTGLGLSLVYEIIQKHNGSISLESREGHGAIFHVILPIRQSDAS